MSSHVRCSMHAPIGLIQDGEPPACTHGRDVVLPIDPGPEHVRPCDAPAVFFVPIPNAIGRYALCGWHLARAIETLPPEDQATVLIEHNGQEYAADEGFVRLEDAPDRNVVAGYDWLRIGLDQRGHAHYVAPETDLVIALDAALEAVVRPQRLGERGLTGEEGYLEHVRQTRGWATFDERVAPDDVDHPHPDAGGESR